MHRRTLLLLTSLILAFPVAGEVVTRDVNYTAGDVNMQGMLAWDNAMAGKRPGILVVHEWWGQNDYARRRAKMLAELGYTALAVDMYGDGKTADHPQDAGKFASAVGSNLPLARARFDAALAALREHPTVSGADIAAIGYCFGGGIVLNMARQGVDVDAVVSYHGSLGTPEPARPGAVTARVMVFNGADDPMVTTDQIAQFKAEMEAAGVQYELVNYPGAMHSFTNPGADAFGKKFNLPLAYDAEADRDSWAKTQALFKAVFDTDSRTEE